MTSPTPPPFLAARTVRQLHVPVFAALRREIARRRAVGEEVFDLSIEDPGTEVSRPVMEAVTRSLQSGAGQAAGSIGFSALQAAAAHSWSLLSGGRPVNADRVTAARGVRDALWSVCAALCDPGDRVLIPAPFGSDEPDLVRLARATPVLVPGDVEWSLKVGVADLRRMSDARTVGLILASPVNPTGAVYTRLELKSVLEWTRDQGLWVIADETYRRLHFGSGPAPSVLDLPDELLDRVIVVAGVGPTVLAGRGDAAVVYAPPAVASHLVRTFEVTTGPAADAWWSAVAAALADDRVEAEIARATEVLRRRRDLVVRTLRERLPGVEFVEPTGACFCLFRVDGFFGPDLSGAAPWCERLLLERGVALAPGDAFGDARWARLTYAVPERELSAALDRVISFVQTLSDGEAR